MRKDDATRIKHILDAGHEILTFVKGLGKEDIQKDRLLSLALVKEIEIIGEAASKISDEKRKQLSEIPWKAIIGMRNRLIHAYDDIDMDVLWDTIVDDIPHLIEELKNIEI